VDMADSDMQDTHPNQNNANDVNKDYIDFHSNSKNSYKINSSYDINQIINAGKCSLLKVKINPNILNEFALINSNFQINYMAMKEDSVYQLSSFGEHTNRINDICFFKNSESPFNQAFISGSSDATIKLWDSRTKDSITTIQTLKKSKKYMLLTQMRISLWQEWEEK